MKQTFNLLELSPADIIIKERARKDLGDLTSLKEDIAKFGVLQPIIINEDHKLVAGERRLTCCKELNISVPCRIIPGLSQDDYLLIERIENTSRKDFTWSEDLDLRLKIHDYWVKINAETNTTWGFRESADKFNCALGGLSSDLTLAKVLISFPELKELATKAKAREAYKKLSDQANAIEAMNSLPQEEKKKLESLIHGKVKISNSNKSPLIATHDDDTPATNHITVGSESEQNSEDYTPSSKAPEAVYAVQPLEEFIPQIPDSTIGMCELDPPYAIDFENTYGKTGNITSKATDWKVDQLYEFYTDWLPVIYQKLIPNSFVLCWTAKEHWADTNDMAEEAGFKVQAPGIWIKKGGSSNTPKTNMISNYEMFLLFRKENATFNIDSLLSTCQFDSVPSSKRIHQWEKPLELYNYFQNAIGRPGSIFLAPFAGSGKSMISAALNNMIPMGCDISKKYVYSFYKELDNHFI